MSPEDLRTQLRRKPFLPFRVVSSDGTTCNVRHPDLVMLGLGSAIIGYPAPGRRGYGQPHGCVADSRRGSSAARGSSQRIVDRQPAADRRPRERLRGLWHDERRVGGGRRWMGGTETQSRRLSGKSSIAKPSGERPRPERARCASESEWGWGPTSIRKRREGTGVGAPTQR